MMKKQFGKVVGILLICMLAVAMSVFAACGGNKDDSPASPSDTDTPGTNTPDNTTPQTTYYTVKFVDYDGTELQKSQVEKGKTPALPSEPTRVGFDFAGWTPEVTAVTENAEYKATYTDIAAPVISLDNETVSFTVKAGAPLALPHFTVADNNDGDISAKLIASSVSQGPVLTRKEDDGGEYYEFTCRAKGEYEVGYLVYDEAGNRDSALFSVRVDSVRDDETTVADDKKDIANLQTDGGVFEENFAEVYSSPLIAAGMPAGAVLSSGAEAINGTSLIVEKFDSACVFGGLENHITKAGYYRVEADIKLVSGTAIEAFYIGMWKNNNDNVDNFKFPLTGLGDSEDTVHFSHDYRLAEDGNYVIALFNLEATDMSIAIDNVRITYTAPGHSDVPTAEEIENGYIIDWTNKSSDVNGGKVISTEGNAELTSVFGNRNVLEITAAGYGSSHFFYATQDVFTVGVSYRVEIDYLVPASDTGALRLCSYVLATTGTVEEYGMNNALKGMKKRLSFAFTAQSGDTRLGLYINGQEGAHTLYIADVYICLDDGYTTTQSGNATSWNWDDNLRGTEATESETAYVSPVPQSLADKLTAADGFGDNALSFTVGSYGGRLIFRPSRGMFRQGAKYTLGFTVYVTDNQSNGFWARTALLGVDGTAQLIDDGVPAYQFANDNGGYDAVITKCITFTPNSDDMCFMIWQAAGDRTGSVTMYFGEFFVREETAPATTRTVTWNTLFDRAAVTANYGSAASFVPTPDAMASEEGFADTVLCWTLKDTETITFTNLGGAYEAGKTYTVTVKLYSETGYWLDGVLGCENYEHQAKTYTKEFTADANGNGVFTFSNNAGGADRAIYFGNMTVTEKTA